MQAACPQCAQRIVIDDAKVPDRAFSVRCPKCQNVVKFPGRGAAEPPPAEAEAPVAEPPAAPSAPEAVAGQVRSFRPALPKIEGRALVSLGDRGHVAAVSGPLALLGVQVDPLDNPEEGARLVEQGVYDMVVTGRAVAAQGRPETIYQRVCRLSPEGRRRIFMILVGDEFKSGDGTQAFTVMADLVLNPRDLANSAHLVAAIVGERQRLYQVFSDVRRRFEESAGV